MRQRPKSLKPKAKLPVAAKLPKNQSSKVRDLENRLAESLEREKATGRALSEAIEQQTATSEILRIISTSPTDLRPVLEAVVESAVRFCGAHDAELYKRDGGDLRVAAHHGPISAPMGRLIPVVRGTVAGRAVLELRAVQVADLQAEVEEFPLGTALAREFGYRTALAVPLLREGTAVGTINLRRTEVSPFTGQQIALLQTFADQAAIAIENVRLFQELQARNAELTESLTQQTATSEVLRVISSSPTDIQPVLDAVAESAARLCESLDANIFRRDGDRLVLAAHHGPIPVGPIGEFTIPLIRGTATGRAVLDERAVHVADMQTEGDEFREGREIARGHDDRTILGVPLIREGSAIGVILLRRTEARLFTERQVALLQTFADQAVIAIENVRLFKELEAKNRALTQAHEQVTEALDQQTATADILKVISSSPTDVQPVFDAIAHSAARLCDAEVAGVFRYDGQLLHFVAHHGLTPEGAEAMDRAFPMAPSRGSAASRAVLSAGVEQVPDVYADPDYVLGAAAQAGKFRSTVGVPMVRNDVPIGSITISRTRPGLLPDAQVELLKTFADQAVIAIENVRLFTELQTSNRELTTALDTQTATSDILRVISRSQTDVQPVFDAIVESAVRLLGAYTGALTRIAGDELELVALTSIDAAANAAVTAVFPQSLQSEGPHAQAIRDRAPLNIADAHTDPRVPEAQRAFARVRGFRSWVVVPMLRHDAAVGTIAVTRRDPGGVTADEIALLETFADQAVIAIENVRLFTELHEKNRALTEAHAQVTEALEQQTATGEVLKVISRSAFDLQPVLESLVENAVRLCGADKGVIYRQEADLYRIAVSYGHSSEFLEVAKQYPIRQDRASAPGRAALERRAVHIHDILADPEYTWAKDLRAEEEMHRTILAVPMLREGAVIGVIVIRRTQVLPFTDKQIELVTTFADQAVIAIENVRLFTELQKKNEALTTAHAQVTEALDQQTATSEILRVISSSPTDVRPVFDTIVQNARRLCGADSAGVLTYDGKLIHIESLDNDDPERADALRRAYPRPANREHATGRAILLGRPVQIPDVLEDPEYALPLVRDAGIRSVLAVPMVRDGIPIGAIAVQMWVTPRPYSDEQIGLLSTFADQAVIAIENVRLFKELEARTQDLTRSVGELQALGEVGQAISSTLDLRTVLSTIVARATQLAGTDAGVIYEYDEQREVFVPRATEHLEAEIVETMLATPVRKGEGATGRLAEIQEPIQVPDILAAPAESRVRGALVRAGYRALLAVPLVREDHLIGGLTVIRKATGEFAPEVIDLLRTFATQSALAIQNARLFLEIEDKSRQLEVASQHKSEFLANMSHELRTPLNAIIGFSEVLTERMFGDLNEKQEEYLKDIYASGTHLLSLINDILDLSKIEAGRMELELTDFNLPQAIDNALTLVRERAGRRGITLQATIDEGLGEVRADERKIRQVALNLLSNAIKFTPEGGRIEVRAVPVDGSVEVSVSDTGVGIAPEDQEAVFEEFRQVGTSAAKQEGTGLGLTLCRKFVELHGGRIRVQSQVDRGSTFTFTIPVRRGE
jgi:GAF domain-containing protein